MQTIQQCSADFIARLADPKRRHRVFVNNPAAWFPGALRASAGAGNAKGSRLKPSPALHHALITLLEDWEKNLARIVSMTPVNFDTQTAVSFGRMLADAIRIDPKCWFTYGRVQKIHCIWLKYQVAAYSTGGIVSSPASNWIGQVTPFAHVPIDRVVLRYLDRSPHLRHLTRNAAGTRLISWKRDLDPVMYNSLQAELKLIAEQKGYDNALHLEMAEIW